MKRFNWRHYNLWKPFFESFIYELIESDDYLQSELFKTKFEDEKDILDIFKNSKTFDSFRYTFPNKFQKEFKVVEAYHSTKVDNVEIIYKDGIKKISRKSLKTKFISEFGKTILEETPDFNFKKYFKKFDEHKKDNEIFFLLDCREYSEFAGHYLIYGSEYYFSLVQGIDKDTDRFRSILRKKGYPTIFLVKLKSTEIKDSTLLELFDQLLRQWILREFIDTSINANFELDFTVVQTKNVRPNKIKGHFHPTRIRDWHNTKLYYNYKNKSYTV